MKKLIYVTGNDVKFHLGSTVCGENNIQLKQTKLEIEEIQSQDGEHVARHKASEAFRLLNTLVVITDDTWVIPALNGFPGTYMQAINTWFSAEDWLRLTLPLDDRRIILRQILVYQDDSEQKLFTVDVEGTMLKEIRGESPYPSLMITSFDNSNDSVARQKGNGEAYTGHRRTAWHDFADWYNARPS
jgi:non-canonical purine NTP pyrophosphatase (RdgB/HAM1 family)